jgi:hypothetical protein
LTAAVLDIVNNRDFQNSSTIAAKKHVIECFSLNAMHAKLEKILFGGVE